MHFRRTETQNQLFIAKQLRRLAKAAKDKARRARRNANLTRMANSRAREKKVMMFKIAKA